ncbi:probable protein phosphatase 2C 21 [Selaginella moellendorffii]|nr:probable protein phosphatase 2C 21 [Selaginella moellendorffii]|eukprot:XP_002987353.2 probable protein phosphatase 2C 21 [Selaginella moellendorffii]
MQRRDNDPLGMFKNWKPDRVHKAVMENSRIRVGAAATQGAKRRMEDVYTVIPDLDAKSSFVAVYDGHGGCAAARFCAQNLHRHLVANPHYQKGDFASGFRQVFLEMDEKMQTKAGIQELERLERENTSPLYSWNSITGTSPGSHGTTAVAVLIRDDKLVIAHAGDSYCMIWRDNKAVPVTIDHNVQSRPDDAERASKAGAVVMKNKWIQLNGVSVGGEVGAIGLQVTRSLGDFRWKSNAGLGRDEQAVVALPDIVEIDLRDGGCEFLVLASDGVPRDCVESICPSVHDWLVEQEESRHGGDGQAMQLAFFCDSMQAMSVEDNKTVVVVQLKRPHG